LASSKHQFAKRLQWQRAIIISFGRRPACAKSRCR
jgi:hypothetical protein